MKTASAILDVIAAGMFLCGQLWAVIPVIGLSYVFWTWND